MSSLQSQKFQDSRKDRKLSRNNSDINMVSKPIQTMAPSPPWFHPSSPDNIWACLVVSALATSAMSRLSHWPRLMSRKLRTLPHGTPVKKLLSISRTILKVHLSYFRLSVSETAIWPMRPQINKSLISPLPMRSGLWLLLWPAIKSAFPYSSRTHRMEVQQYVFSSLPSIHGSRRHIGLPPNGGWINYICLIGIFLALGPLSLLPSTRGQRWYTHAVR